MRVLDILCLVGSRCLYHKPRPTVVPNEPIDEELHGLEPTLQTAPCSFTVNLLRIGRYKWLVERQCEQSVIFIMNCLPQRFDFVICSAEKRVPTHFVPGGDDCDIVRPGPRCGSECSCSPNSFHGCHDLRKGMMRELQNQGFQGGSGPDRT